MEKTDKKEVGKSTQIVVMVGTAEEATESAIVFTETAKKLTEAIIVTKNIEEIINLSKKMIETPFVFTKEEFSPILTLLTMLSTNPKRIEMIIILVEVLIHTRTTGQVDKFIAAFEDLCALFMKK